MIAIKVMPEGTTHKQLAKAMGGTLLSNPLCQHKSQAETSFRVWPDGTVQSTEDGEPHSWMSDDFDVIQAASEEEALLQAMRR